MKQSRSILMVMALLAVNFIYATESICSKMASMSNPMSLEFMVWIAGALAIMAVYAVLWQQILSRTTLSFAYMFKGTSLIFVLLLAALIFHEQITWGNMLGALLIIIGITLYSRD